MLFFYKILVKLEIVSLRTKDKPSLFCVMEVVGIKLLLLGHLLTW